jgi:phosphonate transport system permease protein
LTRCAASPPELSKPELSKPELSKPELSNRRLSNKVRTVQIPPEAHLAPLLHAYRAAVAAKRNRMLIGFALGLLGLVLSCIGAEVNLVTLWDKLGNFTSYFGRLLHLDSGALVWTDPAEWFWGLRRWSILLVQTLLMAYVGTATGAVLAFCACFLASPNLMRFASVRFVVKRGLEFCRTVPDIVFALIFVVAFGLGALPGVLALAIHTAGALGKQYSEVVDNIAMGPVEGVAASGGSWFAQVRFGALPQVLSNFASYGLLRFEINVRSAAVLGFVGAGGIGDELILAIRKFFYADVSAILLMLVVCVMLIDTLSERLRHRLLAMDARA